MITIGIYGFGRFGQFLAHSLKKSFHIITCSRTDYSKYNINLEGITFIHNLDSFFAHKMDILIIATSIISFQKSLLLLSLKLCQLKNPILLIDVCSVKEYPKQLMLEYFSDFPHMEILCTHPMFGPDSAKGSFQNLPFMYDKVKLGLDGTYDLSDFFLKHFRNLGCKMIEMTCEQHDTYTSSSQFITHLTGRVLSQLEIKSTPVNTKGFEMLLGLVNNTENDSFELFKGLYKYNKDAKSQLYNFKKSLEKIIQDLEILENHP